MTYAHVWVYIYTHEHGTTVQSISVSIYAFREISLWLQTINSSNSGFLISPTVPLQLHNKCSNVWWPDSDNVAHCGELKGRTEVQGDRACRLLEKHSKAQVLGPCIYRGDLQKRHTPCSGPAQPGPFQPRGGWSSAWMVSVSLPVLL